MRNYEAIMKMSILQLEAFLDEVYCAGLNNGLYAAGVDEQKASAVLDENPFSIDWLTDEAEDAVLPTNTVDDNRDCLNAFVKAVFLNGDIKGGEKFETSNQRKINRN